MSRLGGGLSEGGRGKGVSCGRKARLFQLYYGNWVKVEGGLNRFGGKSAIVRQREEQEKPALRMRDLSSPN